MATAPASSAEVAEAEREDVIGVEEIAQLDRSSDRNDYCIVQILSVDDVPTYDNGYFYSGTRQDIYIKAYLSKDLTIPGMMSKKDFGQVCVCVCVFLCVCVLPIHTHTHAHAHAHTHTHTHTHTLTHTLTLTLTLTHTHTHTLTGQKRRRRLFRVSKNHLNCPPDRTAE